RPIGQDGLDKALRGITTLDEVSRVVYLPEQGVKMCGSCRTIVSAEFEHCPQCGHFVGEHCGQCKRRMEPQWGFCPTCGSAAQGGRGAPRGATPAREGHAVGTVPPRLLTPLAPAALDCAA